jgi:hypothetical protein
MYAVMVKSRIEQAMHLLITKYKNLAMRKGNVVVKNLQFMHDLKKKELKI